VSGPYDMAAPAMQPQLHERGIHAVCAGAPGCPGINSRSGPPGREADGPIAGLTPDQAGVG